MEESYAKFGSTTLINRSNQKISDFVNKKTVLQLEH